MVQASIAVKILRNLTARSAEIEAFDEWREFRASSRSNQWLYLYSWESPGFFAWGTTTGNSDRIRKAGLFHRSMSGKYDRRVDYLIAKRLYGMPRCWIFETNIGERAAHAESELKVQIQSCEIQHCFHGIAGTTRLEIAHTLLQRLQLAPCYLEAEKHIRDSWEEYISEVYLAFRKIPTVDGKGWRTFYWGDSLEPNFLARKLGLARLAPAIAYMLNIDYKG